MNEWIFEFVRCSIFNPLNKKWNNDEVYKYFQITEEEIKIIEDTI